jgi:hypothetical protein
MLHSLRRCGLVALTASLLSCGEGAYLTAPNDSTISLTANPSFVAAHGGTSDITAFVTEPAGTYVPDGTVVRWTTDLGRIDAETRTRGGIAIARFVSDSRSGIANITAFSGSVSATLVEPLRVGNVRVRAIRLRANPSRITNSNTTHVIATVIDDFGNPIPNVPVTFTLGRDVTSPGTEFLESAGAPVYTNNNGEAEDILRTVRNTTGVAEVQASAPSEGAIITAANPLRIPIL